MKIRFPSIMEITEKGVATLKRFPLALVAAMFGAIAAVWLADLDWNEKPDYYEYLVNICWVAALGISVFVSAATFAESDHWESKKVWLIRGLVVVLLVTYYFMLPLGFTPDESEPFYRYILFFFAAHLLVSFAPFLWDKNVTDFWAYNKTLFLQILTAALYSGVLFAGLSIAMLSLENLLDFDIDEKRYFQLWIILAYIFNTWFFLSGVPKPNQISEKERAYPGGLKVFVQYILIPLITVYILILYLYTGKIILEWEWPNGWVANLVLSFSIAGILALLLLHPIRNKAKNRWINLFSKGYYLALIPLIILLMLSIWVRISEYGVTVNRYFVATLAVWLTSIVAYFIFGKEKNIKVIPISLCVVSILISFGPQGAFEVAKRSQLHRLEKEFQQNEMLAENGTVVNTDKELSFEDRKQISSSITYILDLKGTEPLQPYFEEDLGEVLAKEDSTAGYYSDAAKITDLIGFEYVSDWQLKAQADDNAGNFYYTIDPKRAISVDGYEYYLGRHGINNNRASTEVKAGNLRFMIQFDADNRIIQIRENGKEEGVAIGLDELIQKLQDEQGKWKSGSSKVPVEYLTIEQENDEMRIKMVLRNLNGRINKEGTELYSAFADIYVSLE